MPDTITSLLQSLQQQVATLQSQVTALQSQVAAQAAAQARVQQLASDTQMAVLHVQDTLGQPNA